jgi:hypothetical protein
MVKNYERQVWEVKHRVKLPMAGIKKKFDGLNDWRLKVLSNEEGE